MSHPNDPPEDPHGQGRQPGQDGSDGHPEQEGPRQWQPGRQDGHPPPPGGYPGQPGYHEQTGGYEAAGYQQGGYGPQQGGYAPSSATTGQPDPDERQMGLFAHLGGGLLTFFFAGLGWLIPLIIYLIKKDESPFVRDQAAQALNFQILMTIGIVVSWFLIFLLFLGLLTWAVLAVLALVFGILGGMAAYRGEWYRYPFNVSWIS